jgi:hypothetical protein
MTRKRLENISNYDYHHNYPEYLSSSKLKDLSESKNYFFEKHIAKTIPEQDSTEFRSGSYFHALMTSVGLDEFKFVDAQLSTHKDYKAAKEIYPQCTILTSKDKLDGEKLASNLSDFFDLPIFNGQSKDYIGGAEVTYLMDQGLGPSSLPFRIKIRPDLILKDHTIIDFKSTRENPLDQRAIPYAVLKYKYHMQAALYKWIYEEYHAVKVPNYYLVFSSRTVPEGALYRLDDTFLAYGHQELYKALDIFAMYFMDREKGRMTYKKDAIPSYSLIYNLTSGDLL